jgi:hypothetical protein
MIRCIELRTGASQKSHFEEGLIDLGPSAAAGSRWPPAFVPVAMRGPSTWSHSASRRHSERWRSPCGPTWFPGLMLLYIVISYGGVKGKVGTTAGLY